MVGAIVLALIIFFWVLPWTLVAVGYFVAWLASVLFPAWETDNSRRKNVLR